MSPRRPTLHSRLGAGRSARRRAPALFGLLLLLAVGAACSSASVDRSGNQTREGTLAADQGYWEEAEFRWLKSLANSAGNPRALNNLAVRFERQGEFERAKDFYDRAAAAAGPAERYYIERNRLQFEPIWERIQNRDAEDGDAEDGDSDVAAAEPAAEPPVAPGLGVLQIIISVPDQGPNLAGFSRILIGNFLPRADSEANINDFAVRYFRRRITQRTFFQTQDQLERPIEPGRGAELFDDDAYWVQRAADAAADLVLTGMIGLNTDQRSEMVRERIRSPDGQIREVARFRDSVVYKVVYDYIVLRGEDGERLLEGSLESESTFPADEGISDNDAVFETLEQLLPQVLETITPRRSEQSRYLIY